LPVIVQWECLLFMPYREVQGVYKLGLLIAGEYEGLSKSFRTGRLARELKMV